MWPNKTIRGVTYAFSHLAPFTLAVQPKASGAPTFTVAISFGFHVFTRERMAEDTPDLWLVEGRDERSFCEVRYALSLALPELISRQSTGKAYFSDAKPFLILDPVTRRDADGPYCVFFNMERAERRAHGIDVRMFVVSAYRKLKLPKVLPSITFATLAAKTARGERIVRPRR